MRNTEIKINKSVYLGQAKLDLSKKLIYEFHYDYMQGKAMSYEHRQLCVGDSDITFFQTQGHLKAQWKMNLLEKSWQSLLH